MADISAPVKQRSGVVGRLAWLEASEDDSEDDSEDEVEEVDFSMG